MNDKKIPLTELGLLAVGEIAVSVLTVIIYALLGKLHYNVITGVLLGSSVILLNFIFMCISVNRAIDNIMAERGEEQMDGEQAAEFAQKHKAALSRKIQLSGAVRTLSMAVVLVIAFILGDYFDVIATLVPLIAFRPILMLTELIPKKQR